MKVSPLFRMLCIAACALTVNIAWADPPGRVGRTTYVEGQVSFYSDPDEGWQKAEINYPVTGENSLWVEGRGRAEVRIGPSAIRLNDDSIFDFVKLQDDVMLGFLQQGSVNVRIRQLGSFDPIDAIQIETSEGRFTLEGGGQYRLDAPAGGESRLSVFAGRASFESADRSEVRLTIDAGKQLAVRFNSTTGSAADFRYDNVSRSPFDRWAQDRDRQWDRAHTRYASDHIRDSLISPYMTGYEELDAAGDWIDDNEYGRLWTPRAVDSRWAPYRYGRWSYVRPWGWTWIDDAPWGFAPFHYGRWVQVRSRWCWWPGPYVGRPVYAPALVAWIGGGNLVISSGPAVGWFPLAPREYFVPRYTTDMNYLRRINSVTNNVTVINPSGRYRNQVPGATVVGNNIFVSGRRIGSHATHLPPDVVTGRSPVASFDMPRPSRREAAQMPDRRQAHHDGRTISPPRPRFANDTPPATRPQAPKFRSVEPAISAPLPADRATPEPAPVPWVRPATESHQIPGGSYSTPLPPVSAPAVQPKARPQPQTYSPQPYPAPAPSAPAQVEVAPVMPDREVRPAPRVSGSRQRPQPEVQQPYAPPVAAPIPSAVPHQGVPSHVAPQAATHPTRRQPQPTPPSQVVPTQPKGAHTEAKPTPVPARAPKPPPEVLEESGGDGRGKVKPQ